MHKRFRTSVVTLVLLFTSLSAPIQAQAPAQQPAPATTAKPDFTGTWKINLDKSQLSPAPQPSEQTEILTLSGDTITIDYNAKTEEGRQKFVYSLKIGGPETPFPKPTINESSLSTISSKAEWKDNSLVITQKVTYQGGPGILTSTYTVSPDGKTLTKNINAALDVGVFDLIAIYDKA